MARIVLVGGGSSSGKTYITKRVAQQVGNDNVTLLSLDDYYKDAKDKPFEERVKTNYDHPKAFDWKLIRQHVKMLKEDKPIVKPLYDFVNHIRKNETETIYPRKVVIIEGIMALIDAELRELGDLRIFIRASAERKFLRRMIRDKQERGRTADNIVKQYFATVQPMYQEIIEPSSNYADLIINNDGKKNLAVRILSYLIFKEMEINDDSKGDEPASIEEEFTPDILNKVF